MKQFYKERHSRHQAKMMHYMKYVFNDHFVIMIFFLVGGIGLYYSNLLKSLPSPFALGRWISMILLIVGLSFGKLATLLKEADQVFLLPKEGEMLVYLQSAVGSSRLVAYGFQVLWLAFLMPLIVISTSFSFITFFVLLIMMLLLKESYLWYSIALLYSTEGRRWTVVYWLSSAVVVMIGLYWPVVGAVLSIGAFVLWRCTIRRYTHDEMFQWKQAISCEETRLMRIYRFINLFTDVPEVKTVIKRRAYLDFILQCIPNQHSRTYDYLYQRHFLRSNEYSGLFLRLTLIGGLIALFNPSIYLGIVMNLILVYLFIFQMIPLYDQFSYMILSQLYPVSESAQTKSLQRLLMITGQIMAIILSVTAGIGGRSIGIAIIMEIILSIELALLIYRYLPYRLKRLKS